MTVRLAIPKIAQGAAGSTALPCPRCGGGTAVLATRSSTAPVVSINRQRLCVVCTHRFATIEVDRDWARKMAAIYALLKDLP